MVATAATFDASHSRDPEAWLKRLPADASGAFIALREMVKELSSGTLAASERFALLERLRSRAGALLPELRTHYIGKAVPLADAERAAWESCVGLWAALYFGYALCTEPGNSQEHAATVWHRALDCLGRAIREHTYAYRAVPPPLWKELNSSYRSAEECALNLIAVEDHEQPGAALNCTSAYLATVMHDAANLYALSSVQMQALEQLLPGWVAVVELSTQPPDDPARSPLAIDLCSDTGARLARTLQADGLLRHLDTGALAPKLRSLAQAIRSGAMPAEFAPARTLARPATERLLTHLYIQWCSAGTGRIEERRETALRGQAALNMHAIHFQISGRAFRQPGLRYTREEEHDLATFGHITERTEQRLLTGRSSALEPWELVNQSSSGLLGLVRKSDLASRISHSQLVAMRTSSIDPPFLAVVQRLRIEQDGSLSIGVRVVRGESRGAAVRPLGDPTLKYERALAVEADDERSTPAHLILPPGKFALGSTIELHTGHAEKVTITAILDDGPDHERVAYKIL